MDLIWGDGMAVQIAAALDGVCRAVDGDLVGLHDLLDGLSDLRELHIYPGQAQARVGGLLHGLQEGVELRIEGHGEGGVNDTTCVESKI